ncbi:hypothetical protein JCM8202_004588 [Rhodotorula sphaerocarpa]
MPDRSELDAALARYEEALHLRAAVSKSSRDLVGLDSWYREQLRSKLVNESAGAGSNDGDSAGGKPRELGKDDLVRLMEWKLARGTWRPRLQEMVASNSPASIHTAMEAALSAAPTDRETALKEVCKLKAVGPATASAVLATWFPAEEPFMSDEGLDYAGALAAGDKGKKTKRDYTVKAWREYRHEMQARQKEEGWTGMAELEQAIWAWATLRKYAQSAEEPEAGAADSDGKSEPSEPEATVAPASATGRSGKRRGGADVAASSEKKRKMR